MTDELTLHGQTAVVTGASRGIGLAIARRLARLGAHVVLCARDLPALQRACAELAAEATTCEPFACDVTALADVEALATHLKKTLGKVEILVNNAGMGVFGTPLHELAPEQFERIVNTNLRGVYYMMRAFAPMMIAARAGHIINISSLASKNPVKGAAVYAASKWAINGLSVSAAEELRAYGIRVSIVCPGSTVSSLRTLDGRKQEKMLEPSDIAHVVAMLATQSPQSFVSEVLIRPTQKP